VPYTLLLADDSVTIQRVIELTFADEDVTVIAVSDGDQAIERLEAAPPDIVLADIGMPGKNGYEVAQHIRQSPRLSHIPVMLLTGAFEPVDPARANDASCDGVLAKPFEPQLVISRVKQLLARSHRGPDAHGPGQSPADEGSPSVPARSPLSLPEADSSWAPPLTDARPAPPFVGAFGAEAHTDPVPPTTLNDYFDRLDTAFSQSSPTAEAPSPSPVEAIAHTPAGAHENDVDWFSSAVSEGGSLEPWDLPAPRADVPLRDLPLTVSSPPPEAPFAHPLESFAAVTDVEPVPETAPIVEAAPIVGAAPTAEAAAGPVSIADKTPPFEPASIAAPDKRLAPIEESAPIEPEAQPASPPAAAVSIPAGTLFTTPAAAAPVVTAASVLERPLSNPPLPPLGDAFAALLAAEQGEPLPAGASWLLPPAPPVVVSDEIIETITRRVLERLSDTVLRDAVSEVTSKIAERLIRDEIERIKASIT
jgi:CheY-like chemotaxis protein